MPLCHVAKYCKEVVIPDKNGNPIGGLTCKDVCEHLGIPPGYTKWTMVKGPGNLRAPEQSVRLLDTDTGHTVELSFAECREVIKAYRLAGGK